MKVPKLNTAFVAVTELYTNLVLIRINHRGLKFPKEAGMHFDIFPIDIKKKTFMMEILARGVNVFCAYSLSYPFFFSRSSGCSKT